MHLTTYVWVCAEKNLTAQHESSTFTNPKPSELRLPRLNDCSLAHRSVDFQPNSTQLNPQLKWPSNIQDRIWIQVQKGVVFPEALTRSGFSQTHRRFETLQFTSFGDGLLPFSQLGLMWWQCQNNAFTCWQLPISSSAEWGWEIAERWLFCLSWMSNMLFKITFLLNMLTVAVPLKPVILLLSFENWNETPLFTISVACMFDKTLQLSVLF